MNAFGENIFVHVLDIFNVLSLNPTSLIFAVGMTVAAGLIRGFSGFGATMTLAPSLSLIMKPTEAITVALIMEIAGALQLLPRASRECNWKDFAPLTIAACIIAPFGAHFLITLDPIVIRRMIGGTVVTFVLIMLTGYKFHGQPRIGVAAVIGGLGGLLLGSTGVGGPPVILYLLSLPSNATIARANIILHVGLTSTMLLFLLWYYEAFVVLSLWRALVFFPILLCSNWIGARLFKFASETIFRRFALIFLGCVGAVTLIA